MSMECWVILLAGGKGLRMGGATPKQYLEVAGKPVASHSFDLFREMGLPVVVVASEEYYHFFPGATAFAEPGAERQYSVQNGLQFVPESASLVLVHDAARPCVRREKVEAVIFAAEESGAAVLGLPARNTIKVVEEGYAIHTPPRENLWEVSTPQVVRRDWLAAGLSLGERVTDDVSCAELLGHKVRMVEDHPTNRKLTSPDDLPMIREALSYAAV